MGVWFGVACGKPGFVELVDRRPLRCAGNKGLQAQEFIDNFFCNQHLRTPFGRAQNTGVIILLESALPKNRGAGVSLLTANSTKNFYPQEHRDGGSLGVAQPFLAVLLQPISGHKPRPCALPLRPVILGGRPMKQTHLDCDATLPLNPLSALGILGGVGSPVTKHRACRVHTAAGRVTSHQICLRT